MRGSTEM